MPYLLTTGTNALETGTSSLTPLCPHNGTDWYIVDDFRPPYYDYLLGSNILVSPVIYNATSPNSTLTVVHFPEGGLWSYWFDTAKIYQGMWVCEGVMLVDGLLADGDLSSGHNQTTLMNVPLSEFTAFQRVGAIVPLNITNGMGCTSTVTQLSHITPMGQRLLGLATRHRQDRLRYRSSGLRWGGKAQSCGSSAGTAWCLSTH